MPPNNHTTHPTPKCMCTKTAVKYSLVYDVKINEINKYFNTDLIDILYNL